MTDCWAKPGRRWSKAAWPSPSRSTTAPAGTGSRRISRFGLLALLGLALVALGRAVAGARADRRHLHPARAGAPGRPGDLHARPHRPAQPADQQCRHRRSQKPRPRRPAALIQMRIKWNGTVEVYRIAARGVRLNGTLLKSGRVSWGQVDKLLPPPSGKPFRLPDVVVDLADARVRLDTPYGRLGFAVVGRGNLTGGFKGRLATASPGLDVGACRIDNLHSNVAIAVVARRPQVLGPVSASTFNCPASRIAMVTPRLEVDSSFSEAFEDFDGKGRLAVASFTAGDNGLANLMPISASRAGDGRSRPVRPFGAAGAAGGDLCRPDAAVGRLSAAGRQGHAGGGRRLWRQQRQPGRAVDREPDRAARFGLGHAARPDRQGDRGGDPPTAGNFDASGQLVLVNFPGGGGVGSRPPTRAGRTERGSASPAATASIITGRRAGSASTATFRWAAAGCRAPRFP